MTNAPDERDPGTVDSQSAPPEPAPAPAPEMDAVPPVAPPSAQVAEPPNLASAVTKPSRSVLTTVLLLLVTLLLGIIIGLILERTVLNPEPEAAPIEYPDAQSAEVQAIMDAQFRRDASDPTAMGAVDAPVVIAEWADLRCSYCGRFALETLPALQQYIDDGLVRVEWNDFTVFQEESIDLAVAARAAGDQGLFREMTHAIMDYQFNQSGTDFSAESLVALAEGIGVPDIAAFTAALDNSDEARAEIAASYENAMALFGQAATPKFIVNGQYIGGFLDGPGMSTVIEQELQRVKDNS